MTNEQLPIIDSIEHMTSAQLTAVKLSGFCFVKVHENLMSLLSILVDKGIQFFQKSDAEKQAYAINKNYEGYLNHKEKGNLNIERYAYRGGKLPNSLSEIEDSIQTIKSYFALNMALPFIQKIFENEGLEDAYQKTIDQYTASLSFIYYPYIQSTSLERNLKAHKDFVLMTVLFITKPGLSVYVNDRWYDIDPKPGYVVVNIGHSLEIMTGHAYNSSVHRVQPPKDQDRLSISLFLGPNPDIPICNYKNGKQYYRNFQSLLEEQVKIVYPGTFEE